MPKYMKANTLNQIYIYLMIIGITILLRFPSFFPSSLNWDESTYILIGQSILDGNLPYTELWDVKPPLLFFVFAAIIIIGGKSIFFIRVAGSIFLGSSAFLVYQAGNSIGTKMTGLIAAVLFIVMTGEVEGQAIMSEVIASLPLTSAFLIMLRQKGSSFSYFFLGCLLSMATLIRLNLIYLDLAIFLYYILHFFIIKQQNRLNHLLLLLGFLVPILIMIIPYIITDNFMIFYKSVIEAPLNYSSSQISRSAVTSTFVTQGLIRGNFILWVGFFGGFFLTFIPLVSSSSRSKSHITRPLTILLLWLIAITFSIVSSGNIYPHYIIQILPFMTIISATFFSSKIFYKFRYLLLAIFTIGLFDITKPVLDSYKILLTKFKNGISLENDEGYQLANFLRKANPHREAIYLMDCQIAYWLTDNKPISKIVTHPSTIGKDYLLKVIVNNNATTFTVLRQILDQKPLFIIKKNETWYLDYKPEAQKLLITSLKHDYFLVTRIEGLYVYQRSDSLLPIKSINY